MKKKIGLGMGIRLKSSIFGEPIRALVFDVETHNAVPFDKLRGIEPPWTCSSIAELAFVYMEDGEIIDTHSIYIIPPEGVTVNNPFSPNVTHERCVELGKTPVDALSLFLKYLRKTDYIVGHNIRFDIGMIVTELTRTPMQFQTLFKSVLSEKNVWCTMNKSSCDGWYVRPKLVELAEAAGIKVDNTKLHDAIYDVDICSKVFKIQSDSLEGIIAPKRLAFPKKYSYGKSDPDAISMGLKWDPNVSRWWYYDTPSNNERIKKFILSRKMMFIQNNTSYSDML